MSSDTPDHQIQTKLLKLPDDPTSEYPVRYRSLTPIWHPAVFPVPKRLNGIIMGASQEDVYRQLQDADYACHNPGNIDAAIQYRRDIDRYNQHNKVLQSQLYTECPVCV